MATALTIEKLAGLKRRIHITVPAESITTEYSKKVSEIAKTAKMDGFRPGKVPAAVVKQRFSSSILLEIVEKVVQEKVAQAIVEHEIKIAGTPQITPEQMALNTDLKVYVDFEVYPEVTLADLKEQKIEREVVEVHESDIDQMIEMLRKQFAEWKAVERAVQTGDRVRIDFTGFLDNVPFENGSAKDFELEVGAKRMIPGFEEGIVGASVGEERKIQCTFPEDYHSEKMAGKEATFDIKVHEIKAAHLPELNEEMIKKLGVEEGSEQELRNNIRKTMQDQADQLMQSRVKKIVLDKLLEANPIDAPSTLVEQEISHLQSMAKQRMQKEIKEHDLDKILPREHFKEEAERRVKLGLLLGEVIMQYKLQQDEKQVRERVEKIASAYHQPEEMVAWYYKNKKMLAEIGSLVLEDQAVEKLLSQMQTEEKKISYEDATKQSRDDIL